MTYIKKLVMKGFKSFAPETQAPFSNSMNVIVGPNGSGKSNIADAICFALGRLSIKSLRAAKASNLIFAGTKSHKPSGEASVKIIFDNSDKKFPLENKEIELERIARSNGQGIYKINQETKTRQEVLDLLATAGIDPYGFNIVLQGEIDSIIRMNAEERRKVIEEVAGISIYELRKEKSIHELDKTDEKLKEIQSVLRERTAYLRNLEEERKQALKFKKLEQDSKKFKASIIKKKLDEKQKELSILAKQQEEKDKARNKLKEEETKIQNKINSYQEEIDKINKLIQESSGIEQSKLNSEISDIRAELAGLTVRKENNESKIQDVLQKKQKSELDIKKIEQEIHILRKEFPTQAKKSLQLEEKKIELAEAEKTRKIYYTAREKLNSFKALLNDKKKNLDKDKNESDFIIKEIDRISLDLLYKDAEKCKSQLSMFKKEQESGTKEIVQKEDKLKEQENIIAVYNSELASLEKIKKQVSSLDICPLCKTKITPEHIKQVYNECDEKIIEIQKQLSGLRESKLKEEIIKLKEEVKTAQNRISKAETDLIRLQGVEERKEQVKRLVRNQESLVKEISELEKEQKILESKIDQLKDSEEKYDSLFLEIREISSQTADNLDFELESKERDMEKTRNIIKQSQREEQDLGQEVEELQREIDSAEDNLSEKEEEEKELENKYHKLLEKKTGFEKEIHENNSIILDFRNKTNLVDTEINNLKIEKARFDAEKENLETDFSSYKDIETMNLPVFVLQQRLDSTQQQLQTIGSINLRALEIYDGMKKEYDSIAEKITVLENEKIEIMKIIEEIDKKKRKTFNKTLIAINELFNRNFTQLSVKGSVFLELENPDDPFAAGLDIVIKVAQGKYFDVTSLSGGEQTLVALSLIFAIQEYKPYSFYIFDEVDAALDKRNSERLASLIKKYMKTGQYIVITHNDSIITESSVLYGVSMQEGISKILSLEI